MNVVTGITYKTVVGVVPASTVAEYTPQTGFTGFFRTNSSYTVSTIMASATNTPVRSPELRSDMVCRQWTK